MSSADRVTLNINNSLDFQETPGDTIELKSSVLLVANSLSRDVGGSRGDASGYSEKKVAERFLPCASTTARGRTNFASLPHAVKKFRVLCAISPYGLLGNFWVLVTFRLGLKSGTAASSEVCVKRRQLGERVPDPESKKNRLTSCARNLWTPQLKSSHGHRLVLLCYPCYQSA